MANEFIARKGLIALEDSQITGSLNISSTLTIPGFNDVSASLAAAVAGGDDLGNHTATEDLKMGGNAITNVGNVDGVDVSTLNSSFNTLKGKTLVSSSAQIATDISGSFIAASASFSTRITVNDAKVSYTDAAVTSVINATNIISSSAQIATDISGSFIAASASFSTRVTANDAKTSYTDAAVKTKLNAENVISGSAANVRSLLNVEDGADVTDTSNVTSAGALMDSELAEIATIKALTAAGISGSFNAASSSFSTRVTANDAKLTANTSNVTSAGALMDSEVTNLSFVKGLTGGISDGNVLTANNAVSDDNFLRINGTEVEGLSASEVRTALNVESGADVTDTTNVTAAGALMDSELSEITTVKALTKTGISGSFTAASASFSTRVTANDAKTGYTDAAVKTKLNAENIISGSKANVLSFLNVEDGADVTDTSNVTAAGALMDSELAELTTVRALTKVGISGSFNAASASFSDRITNNKLASASFSTRVRTNETKLTANTSNVQSAGALMDSELAEIATVKALTAVKISGSFTAASASFGTRVTANDAKVSYTDAAVKTKLNTENVISSSAQLDFVDTTGTPADNQISVFTDADTVEGSSKLVFVNDQGIGFSVRAANSDAAAVTIVGGVLGSANPKFGPSGSHGTLRMGLSTSGDVFDFQNNKIAFDHDSTNTYIQADTSNPENLEIHADGNIELRADNNLEIHGPISTNITASGDISASGDIIGNDITSSNNILIKGGGLSIKNQGAQSYARFYCESNNAHYTEIKAQEHANFSGDVTLLLPAYDFNFASPDFGSANLAANNLSGTNTGDQDLSGLALKTAISGAFNADSASFSTRVTANDAKVSYTDAAVTSVINAANILSSSAQIASDISGSFTAASASFSTRVTANDAKLTANTSNVTTAGALMDSELADLAAVKAINQGLTTTSDVTFNDVDVDGTLSIPGVSDVSASLASAIAGGDDLGNHTATTTLDLDGNSIKDALHITASGDISSSGDLNASRTIIDGVVALNTSDSTLTGNVFGNSTTTKITIGKVGTTTSTVLEGNITASSNISSSGFISASAFVGDGSGLTGLSSAAVSTYNNAGDNRIITSVNSTTINSEANLTFDGSGLSVTGHVTASGNISSSSTGSFAHLNLPGFNFNSEASNTELIVEGNITASGDISASGNIIIGSSNLIALNNAVNGDYIQYDGTGFLYKGQGKFQGNLTATGNISASGDITGSDLKITGFPSVSASLASAGGSSTLAGLSDVNFSSLANGDLIQYNSTAGEWQNTNLGLTVSPIISFADIAFIVGEITITNSASYDDPSVFCQIKSGSTVVVPNSSMSFNEATGKITYDDIGNEASRSIELRVQDFGDLQSELVTGSYMKKDMNFRYWKLIYNEESTSTHTALKDFRLYDAINQADGSGDPYPSNMTSNTDPSPYSASGNQFYNATYDYFKAFDSSTSTFWWTIGSNTKGKFINIDLGTAQNIKSTYIKLHNSFNVATNLSVIGSNNSDYSDSVAFIDSASVGNIETPTLEMDVS